jgi:hypothetical protein
MATPQGEHVSSEAISEVQMTEASEESSLLTGRRKWSVYINALLTSSLIAPHLNT